MHIPSKNYTLFASATISSQCSFRADACHTSDRWGCIGNNTLLRTCAWVVNQARVFASLSHASHLRRAVLIYPTFWIWCFNCWKKSHNVNFESLVLPTTLLSYVHNRKHNHLLFEVSYRYRLLYGLMQYNLLLWHNFLGYTRVGILFYWKNCLEQSHTFHWSGNQCDLNSLLQCMQLMGFLAVLEDIHRWQCENPLHILLEFHRLFSSKGWHTLEIGMPCQLDSLCLLDIHLTRIDIY